MDGRITRFAFQDEFGDWLDITTLAPEKRAPSLKARLFGDASIYKPLLNTQRLGDPRYGVGYFKEYLRPHFVKGVAIVFHFQVIPTAEV